MSLPFQSALHFLLSFGEGVNVHDVGRVCFCVWAYVPGHNIGRFPTALQHLKLKIKSNLVFSVSYVNPVCFSPLALQVSVLAGQIKGV